MKKKIMSYSIIISIFFMTTTLSGALDISQSQLIPQDHISNNSEKMIPFLDDPSSAIMAIGIFRLAINPTFSDITGLGLPDNDGKFPARIILNLQWTVSGPGSVILYFNPLTLKFETHTGSTSGHMLYYFGSVEIKEHLIGATDYIFKGIAFSLEITK
jgi:hypothetical protein